MYACESELVISRIVAVAYNSVFLNYMYRQFV